MSRFYPIASGSTGNCTYIGYGNEGILIDVGISSKALVNALSKATVDPALLCGIFITHSHDDHICGLNVFVKKYKIPVFASINTANTICEKLPEIKNYVHIIEGEVSLGGFKVSPFETKHDCLGSYGYIIFTPDGKKCAVCTDLGIVSAQVHNALSGCEILLLESNHDISLLQKSNYPQTLKNRILGESGHLSNNACAVEIQKLAKEGTRRFILGHLSRENNRPEIAHTCTSAALMDCGLIEDEDYTLYIAPATNGKVIIF